MVVQQILSGFAFYFLCIAIGFSQPGSVDPTFDPGAGPSGGEVSVVKELADGNILAGGTFTNWNGEARRGLVRLQRDGTLDPAFQLSVESDVAHIFVHGTNLYAGREALYRLSLDGTRDTNFPPIRMDPQSGTVALAGDTIYTTARDSHRYRAVVDRWSLEGQPEGRLLMSCCPGESITVAEALPDGSVLLGGLFVPSQEAAVQNLARVTTSGVDTSFAPYVAQVWNLARAHSGDIYVVHGNGGGAPGLERFTSAGVRDTNFVTVFDDFTALAIQDDDRLIYGGTILKRLNLDGTLDPTFIASIEAGVIRALALQSDGRLLAGGNFAAVNGVPRNGIVRLLTDDFAPAPEGFIVRGRVTDGVNGVAGVRMRLKKLTTFTNEKGEYRFPGLDAGRYVIRPQMPYSRFKPQLRRVVVSADTDGVDFLLKKTSLKRKSLPRSTAAFRETGGFAIP